jgi:hypothetical protein
MNIDGDEKITDSEGFGYWVARSIGVLYTSIMLHSTIS